MEDAVMGDSTATLVLQVGEGEHLTGSHHRPVKALARGNTLLTARGRSGIFLMRRAPSTLPYILHNVLIPPTIIY